MQMGIESWAGHLSINYQVPLLASVREVLLHLPPHIVADSLAGETRKLISRVSKEFLLLCDPTGRQFFLVPRSKPLQETVVLSS
jgi:hypothetical protein